MSLRRKYRLLEIATAICFVVATLSYSIGSNIIENQLAQPVEFRINHSHILSLGILLELINSIIVIAIGIFLFLRLQQFNRTITIYYVLSRTIEAVMLSLGSLLILNKNLEPLSIHNLFFNLAMITLGFCSLILFGFLIKKSIGPKQLFIIGVIGYLALVIYSLINLLSLSQSAPMWLFAPGAIFEVAFPIWLIVKGLPVEPI